MKQIDWIKPELYDRFQCKGAACRRTCCNGWRITVSKAEYQDLKKKLGKEDARMLRRLPEPGRSTKLYGEFILDEKGCSLQTEEGLCGLQLSMGPEALPDLCIYFPRHGERCGEEMQVSLSPACEAVVELLMEQEGSMKLLREKASVAPIPQVQFSGNGGQAKWREHLQLQEFCLLILQAEDISLDQKMALLGVGIHQLNALYKNGESRKAAGYMDHYLEQLSKAENIEELIPSESVGPVVLLGNFISTAPFGFSNRYSEIASRVEAELEATLRTNPKTGKLSFSYSPETYERKKELFRQFTGRHPYFMENLMVMLFLLKDFCSAPNKSPSLWEQYMYACWVYSSLKFALTACMKEDTRDEEIVDTCVVLLRSWTHTADAVNQILGQLHENKSDTPAHMAMLVQAG